MVASGCLIPTDRPPLNLGSPGDCRRVSPGMADTDPATPPDEPVRDAAGEELTERELQEWDPMPDELEHEEDRPDPGEDPMRGPAPSG